MKKKTIYYIIGILLLVAVEAQGAGQYCYRLHLDGKPGSEPVVWSERAQERRARLGVETDSLDLEISPEYIRQIEDLGWRIVARSRWLNTVVVMDREGLEIEDEQFEQLPFVRSVDVVTTWQRTTAPRRLSQDESYTEVTNEDYTSPLKQVNAYEPLYAAGYRGAGKLVVIVDAGFSNVEQWDWLNKNVIGARDMYSPISGTSKVYDADMHGSCCLSIMAAPEEKGICGTAQEAEFFLIRTETDDSETQLEEDMWVAGAELADSLGADVISSSLGYYDFDTEFNNHTYDEICQNSTFISQGAKVACQKGMFVCNAIGNERMTSWGQLIFPADVEDVLAVGGVMQSGILASFSSPGFTVPYVKPDVVGRGTHCYMVNSRGGVSSDGRGTSFATPLIAGLCTSLWSAVPELTPAQLRQAVRESSSLYNEPDSLYGYGIPDFGVALVKAREIVEGMGVEAVRADAPRMERAIYDLRGQRVIGRPRRGLFIEGGKVWFGR